VPAEGSPEGEDPLRYGAVRLFVERVRAATLRIPEEVARESAMMSPTLPI
jgi:hypothetical protein